jgi:CheY-like chemotaxis protein
LPGEASDIAILVVEDDPDLLDIVAAQVRNIGYRVAMAADAGMALMWLRNMPNIRLLYTDLVLGQSDHGFVLAEKARAIAPSLAVVFTPAERTDVPAGAPPDAEILRKPVPPEFWQRR